MNNLKIRSNPLNNNCWITAHRAANLAVWLLALNAPMTLSHAAEPLKTIELIFNNQVTMLNVDKLQAAFQAQGITVSSYNLDAAKALSQSLSAGLPADPEQARQIMLERLHAQGSAALKGRYQDAYQGLMKSLQYGLDRYPAIVFNQGQAVVYGETDLNAALQAYQRWSAGQ
jgi:integrating conjugative element protein (TIGR03757 family)